ncbi:MULTISPECIES: DUF6525 family protein [unclassified Salipiger]|uniref:DUF6525 family protein n=1 Tax=unclassified Salipiger TaxID=2640570 RepID=UPI0013B8B352|nr:MULTISPECIES: DUF6525 family protein [unclassified Salipiger]NDV49505.1 hypothetical protein [Salipiger sp. PrR003]NDW34367.1 hypothetical protein [Salipiger sp. PrR007]
MKAGGERNLGAAPTRRREGDVMSAYDRLPPDLRAWLAQAALPWSPRSALRAWRGALARTGCADAAAARLSAIEARHLERLAGGPGRL